VLLVATDLRRAAGPAPGLSDTLARFLTEAPVEGRDDAAGRWEPDRQVVLEAVRNTNTPGVAVLPTGGTSGSVDLLATEAFPRLLDVARQLFDVVVLEVAPAPRYADLLTVAPLVDGLVLLVRTEGTSRRRVLEVCERVERLGKPVDVAVLARSLGAVRGLDVRPVEPSPAAASVAPGSPQSVRRPAPSGSRRDV
jgi:Mrp family chromosome partitioning ATPase